MLAQPTLGGAKVGALKAWGPGLVGNSCQRPGVSGELHYCVNDLSVEVISVHIVGGTLTGSLILFLR